MSTNVKLTPSLATSVSISLSLTATFGIIGIVGAGSAYGLALYLTLILVCLGLVVTSRSQVNLFFYSLLFALPFVGMYIPPRSWQIAILDVFGVSATLLAISLWASGRNKTIFRTARTPLFLLILTSPTIAFSIDPVHSALVLFKVIGIIFIFSITVYFLKDKTALNVIDMTLVLSVIVVSIAIIFEKYTGINTSGSSLNLNSITQVGASFIHRPAGLFQDPQKAAQYLSVSMVYILVIWGGPQIKNTSLKCMGYIAVVLGCYALMLTASRLAIATTVFLAPISYILISQMRLIAKIIWLFIIIATAMLPFVVFEVDINTILPQDVLLRFSTTTQSIEGRAEVWKSAYEIFRNNYMLGIGPGNYQEYLMQQNPNLRAIKSSGYYVPTQPESGYLKVLVEVGVLGAISILAFMGWLAHNAIRGMCNKSGYSNTYILAALIGLLAYAICFVTLFTPGDARNLLLPVVMISIIIASKKNAWC